MAKYMSSSQRHIAFSGKFYDCKIHLLLWLLRESLPLCCAITFFHLQVLHKKQLQNGQQKDNLSNLHSYGTLIKRSISVSNMQTQLKTNKSSININNCDHNNSSRKKTETPAKITTTEWSTKAAETTSMATTAAWTAAARALEGHVNVTNTQTVIAASEEQQIPGKAKAL